MKVFLNPLVNWIWIGVGIVILGSAISLVPPLTPASRRVEVRSPEPAVRPAGSALASGFATRSVSGPASATEVPGV